MSQEINKQIIVVSAICIMHLIKGLVSVIIPTYNNAPFLRKCVNSVLAQTYTNIEIIVVDDGSDDNPASILADVSDTRLRSIVCMPHYGVSTARNVGIYHASGEYMVFIDGDDWVESNHLELLVKGLQQAECAIITMQIDYPDHTETGCHNLDLKQNKIIESKDFNLIFEQYLLSSPCNKIYHTKLIKGTNYLQFDKSISYAEDLLFNLEYFYALKSAVILPYATYHYVKHTDSGTLRYHHNTAYTLSQLTLAVSKLFGHRLSRQTLIILMRHYLFGLINLHHRNSDQSDAQILAEIGMILSIPEFSNAKKILRDIDVSRKMQLLLRLGGPKIIHNLLKKYIR